MESTNHHIRSQVFEVGFYKPTDTFPFQRELSAIIRNDLGSITEKCLEGIDEPEQVTSIGRLELDLGKIPHDRLQQQLPLRYREALCKELKRCMNNPANTTQVRPQQLQAIPLIVHFLLKGYMPWNHQLGGQSFNGLFNQSLSTQARAILEVIQLPMQSDKVKMRLIKNLEYNSMAALVHQLEPTEASLIIHYHHDWCAIHKHRPVFKGSEQEVARLLWLFIFKYLYDERGSYFNTRSFLMSTLRQIAIQFNIPFVRLVFLLKLSYAQMSQSATGSTFNHLIADIIEQFDLKEKPDALTAEAALNQPMSKKEPEIDLSWLKAQNDALQSKPPGREMSFDALFKKLLAQQPKPVLAAIRLLGTDEQAIYKLIEPLEQKTIYSLIQLIEPAHAEQVIAYQKDLVVQQEERTFIKTPIRNFSRVIWAMIIVVLIDDRGSRFNQKAFAGALLRRMASRFNLSYISLLSQLHNSLKAARMQPAGLALLRIISELHRETFGTTRKPSKASLQRLANIDTDLLLKSIMEGNIHPKLSFWQKLPGGLCHLIWLCQKEVPQRFKQLLIKGLTINGFVPRLFSLVDPELFINQLFKGQIPLVSSEVQIQNETLKKLLYSHVHSKKPDLEAMRRAEQANQRETLASWAEQKQLIKESILSGKLHPELDAANEKPLRISAFIRKLIKEDPQVFRQILTKAKAAESLYRQLRQILKSDFLMLMGTLIGIHPAWSRVYLLLLAGQPAGTRTTDLYRIALAEFILRASLGEVSIKSSVFEKLLLQVAKEHQLEIRQLIGLLLKLAIHAQYPLLKRELQNLLWHHRIRNDKGMLLSGYNSGQEPGERTVSQRTQWVLLLVQTLQGKDHTAQLKRLGFENHSELLHFLLSHEPELLKRGLHKYLPPLAHYKGIGSILSYKALYKLLVLLAGVRKPSFVRFLVVFEERAQGTAWTNFTDKVFSLALRIAIFDSSDADRLLEGFLKKLSEAEAPVIIEAIKRLLTDTNNMDIKSLLRQLKPLTEANQKQLLLKHSEQLRKLLMRTRFNHSSLTKRDSTSFPEAERELPETIFIDNAGLVLLNAYFPQLLKQLELLPEAGKPDPLLQERGVVALQHVLLDDPILSEEQLLFNKLLMGLELNHLIIFDGFVGDEKAKVIQNVHDMIKAYISHWPAIGQSSVDGFRANWLYRRGKLELAEEHWELHVERQPYDILMDQLPFSISLVNLSWMNKPLTVYWQ